MQIIDGKHFDPSNGNRSNAFFVVGCPLTKTKKKTKTKKCGRLRFVFVASEVKKRNCSVQKKSLKKLIALTLEVSEVVYSINFSPLSCSYLKILTLKLVRHKCSETKLQGGRSPCERPTNCHLTESRQRRRDVCYHLLQITFFNRTSFFQVILTTFLEINLSITNFPLQSSWLEF